MEEKNTRSIMDDDNCCRCGEEVDIFGAIIDDKMFCGDCAEPHLTEWFSKNGRVEMPPELQKKVAEELMSKKVEFNNRLEAVD